jgi:two-component system response regulator DesR
MERTMNNADKSPRGGPKPLTERERLVLRLVAEGHTNTEIASSLHLAPSTVKGYVSSIMWKLEAHTRKDAVREAEAARIARDPTR